MEIPDLRMAAPDGVPCNNPRPMPATINGRESRRPHRRRSITVVAASLVVLVAACGSATPSSAPPSAAPSPSATAAPPSTAPSAPPPSTAPSPGPSGDLTGVYQTIENQV